MKAQSRYTWFRAIGSLLLLSGYFLNVISFESFHQSVHQHNHSELHNQAAEQDACHRAIYHGDVAADCHHKGHFAKTVTDCDLCKVTVSRFHFASRVRNIAAQPFASKKYSISRIEAISFDHSDSFSPRGPPAFS